MLTVDVTATTKQRFESLFLLAQKILQSVSFGKKNSLEGLRLLMSIEFLLRDVA